MARLVQDKCKIIECSIGAGGSVIHGD